MNEDLNYATVTFKSNGVATPEQTNTEIIYDEVKTEEMLWDPPVIISENKKKPHVCSPLRVVLVSLGILCVVLVSIIITLCINFRNEQRRQNVTLTMQNQKLLAEKEALKRRTEDVSRERDRLNWTMGVILQYDTFPVNEHCPHRACKPCLDDWVPFQSSCYLFTKDVYSYSWKTWANSRRFCQEKNTDLVVIDSQEEQEFINNHTSKYKESAHGYWIGLSITNTEPWTWVDGSNVTLTFWTPEQPGYRTSCALSNPHADPSSTWDKKGCDMKNRWICEGRALIPPD